MKTGLSDRLGPVLLLFAAAWPLQVYAYVPGLKLSAIALLAALLVFFWCADLAWTRKPRMPFEIAWVWVALFGAVWLAYAAGLRALPMRETGALLVFAATYRFARQRNTVLLCLIASAFAAGLCALFSFSTLPPWRGLLEGLHPLGRKLATAYSLEHEGTLAFAYDLPSGVQILLVALCCAAGIARLPLPFALRFTSMGVVLFIAAALLSLLAQAFPAFGHWPTQARAAFTAHAALLALLVLWGLARIAAKIEIDRRCAPARLHRPILAGLALALASAILFPVEPALWHGFMAALACAFATPNREPEPPLRFRGLLAVLLVLPLLGVNLAQVHVDHLRDPRNYEAAAKRALDAKDYALLTAQLDRFEDRFGIEGRTQFWRAQGCLDQGLAIQAAAHFVHAQNDELLAGGALAPQAWAFYAIPVQRAFLPKPSQAQVDAFLSQLRDVCSALPDAQRAFAFEQALVAVGEEAQAFALVEDRVNRAGQSLQGLPIQTLWLAYGRILGLPVDTLPQEWDAAKMAGLLLDVGARVVDVKAYPPLQDRPGRELWAPAIAYAQCYRSGLIAFAVFRTDADSPLHARWKRDIEPQANWGSGGWQVGPISNADEQLRLHLVLAEGGAIQERLFTLGRFPLRTDPFTVTTDTPMLSISPNAVPGLPALLILLDAQAPGDAAAAPELEPSATF